MSARSTLRNQSQTQIQTEESIQLLPVQGDVRVFSRLTDALHSARSGDTVKIQPGKYVLDGPLAITQKNLSIEASEANVYPPAAFADHTRPILTVQASGVKIVGLHFFGLDRKRKKDPEGELNICVAVYEGDAHFESCSVSDWNGAAMLLTGSSCPHISNCAFHVRKELSWRLPDWVVRVVLLQPWFSSVK